MPKSKKTKEKPERAEPSLDPILPLPAGTGIPYLREGEGKDILLLSSHVRTVELTYRAFYVMWEQAEALAKKNYPRYIDGPMENVALAALEAVAAFRSAFWQCPVTAITEQEAVLVREAEKKGVTKKRAHTSGTALVTQQECSHEGFVKKTKSKKTGEKLWKCENCGLKWPRKASPESSGDGLEGLSKARKTKKKGSAAPKPDSGSKKRSKTGLKKRAKSKK